MPEAKAFNDQEKRHMLSAMDLLIAQHKRAENQYRVQAKTAIADAVRNELDALVGLKQKMERMV